MNLFKIGDKVIPGYFQDYKYGFTILNEMMESSLGREFEITAVCRDDGIYKYQVDGWWWPEPSLSCKTL